MKIIDVRATVETIFRLAKAKGLTVRQLADILCVSNMAVYNWRNLNRLPSVDHLVMLTEILDVPLDDIIKTERRMDGRSNQQASGDSMGKN